MKRPTSSAAAMLAISLMMGEVGVEDLMGKKPVKPTKPCLECGEEHSHNNRWCSAKCCKAYRAKEKK